MKNSPFLTHVTEVMYQRHYAKKTIESYIHWIYRFICFNQKRHPYHARHPEQDQLGHADLRTTQIYTHILQREGNSEVSPLSRIGT